MTRFKIISAAISLLLLTGSVSAASLVVEGQAKKTPEACSSLQNVEAHLYHSMFKDQASAENSYQLITAMEEKNHQSMLMTVARTNSIDEATKQDGGDLGFINRSEFRSMFGKELQEFPLKKLSLPIRSKFGWHILWIESGRDSKSKQNCL